MKTKEKIILTVLVSLFGLFSWLLGRQQTEIQTIKRTERITVDHYLTDVKFDTMYFNRYDTLEYYKQDTIWENGEIVLITDTIQVPIPISVNKLDTTLYQGDSIKTQIKASISGFNVALDTLSIHNEIMQYKPNKSRSRLCLVPAVGLGYGTGGFGAFVGIGVGRN